MADTSWLPSLLPFDWNDYVRSLKAAYAVFQRDFGSEKSRPPFQGRRLGLKRYPEFEGKSATFWHFITEGPVEANRTPARDRIERIPWPKPMILEAAAADPRVRVWSTLRGTTLRWVIAVGDFSYVVILDDRGEYLLPWTAFTVEQEHRRAKLRKEWNAWKAALQKS